MKSELKTLVGGLNISKLEKALDVNKSGVITKYEYLSAIQAAADSSADTALYHKIARSQSATAATAPSPPGKAGATKPKKEKAQPASLKKEIVVEQVAAKP